MTKDEEKKAKDELEAYALEKFGVDLDKRKSLESLQAQVMELDAEAPSKTSDKAMESATVVIVSDDSHESIRGVGIDEDDANEQHAKRLQWLQERAVAIWQGQSSSLPIGERIGRIRAAMKDRGYSQSEIEQIELPTNQDYKRFL